MNESLIGWLFFLAYLSLTSVAAFMGFKQAKGLAAFSVGNRQNSPIFIGLSLAANLTSAATFVINPGLVYHFGLAGFLGYSVATPLGLIVGLTIVSKRFRKVGDQFSALTVPQWIGTRFKDERLTFFYAFLSLLLIAFLVLLVIGMARVLVVQLSISIELAIALTIAIPVLFIRLGGAGSHILVNVIQALIMVVVAVMLIGSGLEHFGSAGILSKLTTIDPMLAAPVNPQSALFRTGFEVFFCNFVIGVAVVMQPHVISKALYLKTENEVNHYLWTGLGTVVLYFMVLVVGLYARIQFNDPSISVDAVVPTYLVKEFSPFARGIVAMGLLAAGFSTMEGLLVALSSIFANDFYKNLSSNKNRPTAEVEEGALKWGKIFLLVLAPVLFFISLSQVKPNLSVAIFAQNGVYGLFSATFVPILFGIFSKKLHKTGVIVSALVALVVHFGMYYGKITIYANNPAVTATCALIASCAVAFGFVLLSKQPLEETEA
jgi:SSS family solute:Na+ symporter/sodium/pantothenate symporter